MNRRHFLGFAALPLLAACGTDLAPALTQAAIGGMGQQRLMISTVTVNAGAAATETVLAASYRARLGAELKTALEAELSDRISPMGLPLVVDLSRFGLAGAATAALGEGQSTLAGRVRVLAADRSTYADHQVTASLSSGDLLTGALLGGGLAAGDQTFTRLLREFATDTREAVFGRESVGSQIIRGMAG